MTSPTTRTSDIRLIETDAFAFEFLSELAERESWRKEIHRPVYHIHKWWAQRLGSVFRGILLGSVLPADAALPKSFYLQHSFGSVTVFDPFMGSGTTIGEAHKLGMTALGRDINPVAARSVNTAMGPLERRRILIAFDDVSDRVEQRVRGLYRGKDSRGRACEVLYFFWVMQANCSGCAESVDLFPSHIVARNAHPDRKSHVQVRCPACANIFQITHSPEDVTCASCRHRFDATAGTASGANATCSSCGSTFPVLKATGDRRPRFRLYGKLVLCGNGRKEYLPAIEDDLSAYERCGQLLAAELDAGHVRLPSLRLMPGHNTRQAMNYRFDRWTDFFNDRQLLALSWLRSAIRELPDATARDALLMLFSGALEFNNMFASYKGEGTGAVRHMFSHHILKPERTPIEANVWGTPKSSGGFSNLLRSRLLRAIDYRDVPTEVNGSSSPATACSLPFSGRVEPQWPAEVPFVPRGIYLSVGDSARTELPEKSVDIVATDPPFFDNVHYSELADFFHAWQQLDETGPDDVASSTRQAGEVQDADAGRFASKLRAVFAECHRVLRDNGLLVFTYHHSRHEGWQSLADAIWSAGFDVVNSHPVKAEMSVATPKFQAKEPIQLDIILICRKRDSEGSPANRSPAEALDRARNKLRRLADAGFKLSRNDRRITLIGQLLAAVRPGDSLDSINAIVERALDDEAYAPAPAAQPVAQMSLFES
jgi:putative DNA methylase